MLPHRAIDHRHSVRLVQLTSFALIALVSLSACRPAPVATLPPTLKPSLAWPECPKIGGMYELQGEALPGSMNFYRNRDNKLTLNAMLGVAAPADLTQ